MRTRYKLPGGSLSARSAMVLACFILFQETQASPLTASINKNNGTALVTGNQLAQTITGTVKDATGEPLIGVSVMLKGTAFGTTTDSKGNFSLNSANDSGTLIFSYVGYIGKEVNFSGAEKLNVVLQENTQELQGVVVIGYGTQRKSDVTGSLSSISTKDFAEQPVNRVDQVLQGRATGVQVTNASGAPGGDVRIRIRGANSVLGSNDPLYVLDGFVGADFTTVNTEDIESIQILKDASSTAIYGSRGANGVVIITTKKGTKGSVKVNYIGQGSSSKVIKTYDLLPAGQFAQLVNARNVILGLNPAYTPAQLASFQNGGGTDWQKEIYRTAGGQEHQLSVSGGSDKTTFLTSINYLDQDGVIKNSGYKRYNFRTNINSQINDKLSFRVNATGTRIMNSNTQLQSGTGNPVVQALAWAPTTPVYDANGIYTAVDPVGSLKTNPVALLYDRSNLVQNTYGNIIGGGKYEPIKGLSLDLTYGVKYLNQQTQNFNGNIVTTNNPTASRGSAEQVTFQGTNAINYKHTFGGVHNLDAVAVFEVQKYTSTSFNANATGLLNPALGFDNLGLANSANISSDRSNYGLVSYLGRINYSYKDEFLLSASVRRDGSSKFQGNNQFSTFPAVAAGWNLSNEDFVKDMNVFSNLKLRGSWGRTGSQAIQPYATQSTYSTAIVAFNNNNLTSGIVLGNPGNPNLKWETTTQADIGLEVGLFNGRLNIEADYFNKRTTDLLLNRPLPGYVGGGTYASNVGEIQNKGWELSIGGNILNTPGGGFTWSSNFNISNVKNKVVSLGGVADMLFTGSNVGAAYSTQSEFVIVPGQALGSYWGLQYLGTWKPSEATEAAKFHQVPGDSHYLDVNKDGAITSADYKIIGNGIPKTSLGWNNTFGYKGFTLNVFFQGILGVDKMNYSKAGAMTGSADARQITLTDINNRYIPGVNETSNIPAFSKTDIIYAQSSRFLENGNFIRLKNVSLSYVIPKSVISDKVKLKLFVSATNLWTITKYSGIDPEASNVGSSSDINQSIDYGAYPNAKVITGGVNLTF